MLPLVAAAAAAAACGRLQFDALEDAASADVLPAQPDAPACAAYVPMAGLTSRYRIVTTLTTWPVAELDCESDGGHLVVTDEVGEPEWIASMGVNIPAIGGAHIWIGMSANQQDGTYRWVTDETVDLGSSFWRVNEPTRGPEQCGEINGGEQWNDLECDWPLPYACECDGVALPTPPTWCDTMTTATCGDCSTQCTGGQSCIDQVCM